MRPKVDKWLDLLDRVGWTALAASAGATITVLTSDGISWQEGLKFIAVATVVTVAKVIVGQNTGTDDTGSLIGKPVIEPPPVSPGGTQ